ncbi:hypothetical protein DPMN_115732 [Dreissena polymorpha]|uniref:Uncharacterized protein n=1 Tax=Dreissena polymorpha TaxID=45954 RepID=A0A9D4QSR0_DREPO|nr:hypothetical protein DPMN_115732 [Dreissena polymorpha]
MSMTMSQRKAQTKLPENQETRVKKTTTPWPCVLPIQTIIKINCRIQETNLLTKFHEDWAKNENIPPPGGHVFLPIRTIFELNRHIQKTHLLTKFHEDGTKIENCPAPWRPCFLPIWTIFELVRDINKTHGLIVTFRMFTRFLYSLGGHLHEDWASNVTSTVFTSFELSRDLIINVASRVFTRQTVYDARRTTDKRRSQKLTMSTLCSGHVFPPIGTIFKLIKYIIGTNLLTKKNAPPPGGHVFQPTGIIF